MRQRRALHVTPMRDAPSPPAGPLVQPPVSALAIVAAALSAVLCCPLASIASAALGVAALWRIKRAHGRLRGRGLAIAAIAVSAGAMILQNELAVRWSQSFTRQLDGSARERVSSLMTAVERRDASAAAKLFSKRATPPTPEVLDRFAAELKRRYGRYQGMSIVARTPGGPLSAPTMTVATTFTFERRELTGGVVFASDWLLPNVELIELSLGDAAEGELTLGSLREPDRPSP